jgi:hypothetical protein
LLTDHVQVDPVVTVKVPVPPVPLIENDVVEIE